MARRGHGARWNCKPVSHVVQGTNPTGHRGAAVQEWTPLAVAWACDKGGVCRWFRTKTGARFAGRALRLTLGTRAGQASETSSGGSQNARQPPAPPCVRSTCLEQADRLVNEQLEQLQQLMYKSS
jgi:hypothetical protein